MDIRQTPTTKLRVVRSFDQMTLEQLKALAKQDYRTNWKSNPAIAKKYGFNVAIAIELQKEVDPDERNKGKVRVPKALREWGNAAEEPKSEPLVGPKRNWWMFVLGGGIGLCGLTFGFLEVSFDWQYYSSMGRTPLLFWSFAIGGATIGIVNMGIPPALPELWKHGSRTQFWAAVVFGMACFVMTIIADVSFSATNIGDTTQVRDDAVVRHAQLTEKLHQIEVDRQQAPSPAAIAKQIEDERRNVPENNLISSEDCTKVSRSWWVCSKLVQLRKSKKEAEDMIADLDAKWQKYSDELKTVPVVSSAAPGAEQIAGGINLITSAQVGTARVLSFQIGGLSVLFALGPGLLLAFARTLMAKH